MHTETMDTAKNTRKTKNIGANVLKGLPVAQEEFLRRMNISRQGFRKRCEDGIPEDLALKIESVALELASEIMVFKVPKKHIKRRE